MSVIRRLVLVFAIGLAPAVPASAVDGAIEINQTQALAGGVTPSDTPGFPVTLDAPGSYVLTGNLALSAAGDAIAVTTDNVAIDLNGFSLVCEESGAACSTGHGIEATNRAGLSVRDGFVTGFGDAGIEAGERTRIEDADVSNNPGWGLLIDECVLTDVIVWGNGKDGVVASDCTINSTVAYLNGASGITIGRGTVSHSVGSSNTTFGIGLVAGAIRESAAFGNTTDGFLLVTDGLAIGLAAAGNGGFGLRGPPTGLTGGCTEQVGYAHSVFDLNAGVPTNSNQVEGCTTQLEFNVCDGSVVCP